jgi:8-amino-7-oxononanoate synthase
LRGGFGALPDALASRRAEGLYRNRGVLESAQGPRVRLDGVELLSFCSNDYLGLANDPRVVAAFREGAARWGAGSGASHLVSGHMGVHHALEEALAAFTGRERALLFSSGYAANLGVVGALLDKGDVVFEDRLNHASLIDAAQLSGARLQRFLHNDVSSLDTHAARIGGRRRMVAVDGVFSMDGDEAPLAALADACDRHDTLLLVDDAHGFGVLGASGAGSLEAQGVGARVELLMGTLGKALGTAGAFVAGDATFIETLVQHARTYIYTTALPPAVAAAALESLRIVQEEGWRRERLGSLVLRLRAGAEALGLSLLPSRSPIQPLVLGDAGRALAWAQALRKRGILVPAIRPPTVPRGSARLRITLSAAHENADVDRLLEALAEVARA